MNWLWLAVKSLAVSVLAFPLATIIVLLDYPSWSWPWMTHDNPPDGDSGHWLRWPDNGTKWRVFCRRVAWMWRNKGYGYAYDVCGVIPSGTPCYKGNPLFWLKKNPSGWCYAKFDNCWMLFAWFPYGNRGIRIYLGWKLREKCEHPESNNRQMICTHINPFKGTM